MAQLARALDQAAIKTYLATGATVVLGIGLVTIALRGGVRPIFVPYDQFGRVIRSEDLSRFRTPPRRFVDAALAEWLVNVRRVYFADPVANLDNARAAKALLAPEAEQWLDQYFADPARDPRELAKVLSRTVDGVTMSKDPDRDVWYLQWREIEVPLHGGRTETAWQGTVKLQFSPPRTETGVYANAAGIRITSIEWNRLASETAAGAEPAAASLARPVAPVDTTSPAAAAGGAPR